MSLTADFDFYFPRLASTFRCAIKRCVPSPARLPRIAWVGPGSGLLATSGGNLNCENFRPARMPCRSMSLALSIQPLSCRNAETHGSGLSGNRWARKSRPHRCSDATTPHAPAPLLWRAGTELAAEGKRDGHGSTCPTGCGAGRASHRGRAWGGAHGQCSPNPARAQARTAQALSGGLLVGGADRTIPDTLRDRPQLRAANQLCPQLIEISRCCVRCVVGRCA